MERTAIIPHGATKPIGKYSPAMMISLPGGGRLLFISGQVASDDLGNTVSPGDAAGQASYVFERISRILEEAGGAIGDLVSLNIYLTDMTNFGAVSGVRNSVLVDPPPASTLVEVSSLAIHDHLVEISAVAAIS